MGRVETVTEQMKAALKAKESASLAALRNIRAAFLVEMKKDGAETLEEDAATILERVRDQSIARYDGKFLVLGDS